jgi:hypothetical protein
VTETATSTVIEIVTANNSDINRNCKKYSDRNSATTTLIDGVTTTIIVTETETATSSDRNSIVNYDSNCNLHRDTGDK